MDVYLDNSATTKIKQEVLHEMIKIYETNYANPSSLHKKGLEIEKKIDESRYKVAKIINANPNEIYFTSGGTESNNMAIFGHLSNIKCDSNIITTKIEHPSVYNVYKHFEKKLNVKYLDTNEQGKIDLMELKKLINKDTLLLSIILVNNEIGSVQNLKEIINIIKENNSKTKIHVDAVQAYGKIKIDVTKTNIDTMSFSSHKIHGPKGCGGLYIRRGCKIETMFYGGNQEKGMRAGTENTAGIVGFGKASELIYNNFNEQVDKLYKLKNQYANRLQEEIQDVKINSSLDINEAPHILSVSFKNIKGEVLIHYLEEKGIYVSTGSACSSKNKTNNRVLESIKLDPSYIDGTIRISLGFFNDFNEIEYVVEKIKQSVNEIREIMK